MNRSMRHGWIREQTFQMASPIVAPEEPEMAGRSSLLGLMATILLISLVLKALNHASDSWAVMTRAATTAVLLTSPLGVIYTRGPARAGWVGVALFGWGATLLAAIAPPDSPIGLGGLTSQVIRRLPARWVEPKRVGDTVTVLRGAGDQKWEPPQKQSPPSPPFEAKVMAIAGDHYQLQWGGANGNEWLDWMAADRLKVDNTRELVQIVDSLLVLVLATMGATLGRIFYMAPGTDPERHA